MSKRLAGIDIGGGSIRCIIYELKSRKFTIVKTDMLDKAVYKIGEFGYGIDTDLIWSNLVKTLKACVIKSESKPEDIAAMAITTFRHSAVAIDESGKVLYASANRDARAVDQTMRLNDMADGLYAVTGKRPMPILTACKLMWLKDTDKGLYDKIRTVFTLNDYIVMKLTGKVFAERTNAAESMLYDLKNNCWSDDIITKLGIKRDFFPAFIESGAPVGNIVKDIAGELGLSASTLIVSGAGDTQSALLGLNAVSDYDIGVVAGTTTPVQMTVPTPLIDGKKRLWTGVSAIAGKYVIESNAGGSGMSLEWISRLLFKDNPRPVAALMASAGKASAGAGGVLSTIGASVFNCSVLSLPIDSLICATTNHTPDISDRYKASRAALEGINLAIRANIEQLEEVSGKKAAKVGLGGGMSRDRIFGEILSAVSRRKLTTAFNEEVSLIGAVICAACGAKLYNSLEEAAAAIAVTGEIESDNDIYDRIYEEWLEMYNSSKDANMGIGALITELKSGAGENKSVSAADNVRLRIYVDADLSGESIKLLEEFGGVTFRNYRDGEMLEGDEMIETLKDYDVFITEVDIVDARIIKALPNLRMIGVCRGNPTNIDIDACSAAGIPVVYTPGRNSDAVADLTLAMILNIIRMVPQAAGFLKEEGGEAGDMGRMGAAYFRYQGMELWNKTVGIIGGGAIGKKVAKRLSGFDADILVYDPYLSREDAILMGAEKVEFDYLLKNSDIITLHAPVTESTKNMINADAFDKMKQGVYFVNTARAALVDYNAMRAAIKSGKVRGAALDVFEVEPPSWNDPLVQAENVLCTPHIGGNTVQVGIHQGQIMAENIKCLLRGEMTADVVNRDRIGSFSFTGEKVIDGNALEKLSGRSVGVNDLDADKQEKSVTVTLPKEKKIRSTPGGAYGKYMELIAEFLDCLSSDAEVREKTKSKDISFQITFKDNEESCYMYFKGGEVMADLGEFPNGPAEVNLRMPIEIFDGMMRGEVNGAKAAMTGKMSFTGNVRKAMSMQSIMKLMMGAYEKALNTVGDIDVKNLKPEEKINVKEVAATTTEKSEGFFSKLRSIFIRPKEQIICVNEHPGKTGDVRDEILQVTNELYTKGLITGIGGNISARCEDNLNHVWITPSSVFKGDLRADMMVRIDLDGNNVGSVELSASSEKMVHLAIYKKRPEIMSVIHSHAPKATLMALTKLNIKPISTDAAFVGEIPIVPFVIPGSPELGEMVAEAIGKEGSAAIMQNHGLVVCGNSVRRAADTTEVIEITAAKILECKLLNIEPVLLPDEARKELESIGKMLV